MKQIKDITLEELKKGLNWKVKVPDDVDTSLENYFIEETDKFKPTDTIAYSAIMVFDNGEILPLIQIKEVEYLDYGGDYCERRNRKWQQLGLTPNPNLVYGVDYVANPLEIDPSFDTNWDHRAWHRENFRKYVEKIKDV